MVDVEVAFQTQPHIARASILIQVHPLVLDAAREHLRELLRGNTAGDVTLDEARELDQMMLFDDLVSLIRAPARTTGAESRE